MNYQNYDERKVEAAMLCKDDLVRDNGHTYRVVESNPDSSTGGSRAWHLRLRNPDGIGGIEVWTARKAEYTLLIPRVSHKRFTVDMPQRMGHSATQVIMDEISSGLIDQAAKTLLGRTEMYLRDMAVGQKFFDGGQEFTIAVKPTLIIDLRARKKLRFSYTRETRFSLDTYTLEEHYDRKFDVPIEPKKPKKLKARNVRPGKVVWFNGGEVEILSSANAQFRKNKPYSRFDYVPIERLDEGGYEYVKDDLSVAIVPADTEFEVSDVFDD